MRPRKIAPTTQQTNAAQSTVVVAKVVQYTCFILATSWVTSIHSKEDRSDRIESEIIAKWDFGAKEDTKRDGWPDGWSRSTGQSFPKFIPIAIVKDSSTKEELETVEQFRAFASRVLVGRQQSKWPWEVNLESTPPVIDQWLEQTALNPYLRAQMDGGAIEVSSPQIAIDNHSLYFASAKVRGLSPDFEAIIKLKFLDEQGNTMFEVSSKPNPPTATWLTLSTESNEPFEGDIRFVRVVLSAYPKTINAYRADFGFDAIAVHQTPRLRLTVDKDSHSYHMGDPVTVRCVATGMKAEQPSLKLTLHDHDGNLVQSVQKNFIKESSTKLVYQNAKLPNASSMPQAKSRTSPESEKYWHGYCEWTLPPLQSGFYEISTQMTRGRTGTFDLTEQFVVLPNDGLGRSDSRFGWSMTDLQRSDPNSETTGKLVDALRTARVAKAKVPIWFDSQIQESSDAFTERVDRLQAGGVQCIGVISAPPMSLRKKFPRLDADSTGQSLEDSVLVQSFLEPVLRQMCLRIVDFQIGWDHETDFVSNPRFSSTLEAIQHMLRRYGQETFLIAAHNPDVQMNPVPSIDRWQLHRAEDFTEQDLLAVLGIGDKSAEKSLPPWHSVTPIAMSRYSLDVRVQDLAARMLAVASESGTLVTTAWVTDPVDNEVGMLDPLGNPREMYIPFRTLSGALAGLRNAGSLPNSGLEKNYLVHSAEDGRIVTWSAKPKNVQMYLGKNVTAFDVWGRSVQVESQETERGLEQSFMIGRWPIILSGVDINVAKWRMGIKLLERKVDPLVGQVQELKIQFANPLPITATGTVRIVAPTIFVESTTAAFEVAPNETGTILVPVQVLPDADTSETEIALEFDMAGDHPIRFSMQEWLQVGTDDFEFEISMQMDDQDQLWVTVEAINYRAEPTSFDCMLLIPNRPRERTQIANLTDRSSRVFVIRKGSELLNETLWLRCEQIGTRRVENKRIQVDFVDQEPN
jgi:hypothetical protein